MVTPANYNIAIGQGGGSSVGAAIPVRNNAQPKKEEQPQKIDDAKIKYHKIKLSDKYSVQGNWTEDYIKKVIVETSSKELEKNLELMSRYRLITFKLPDKQTYLYLKDCYIIDSLEAPQRYKGAGTKALQNLLEKSLADKDTEGRIVVYANIVDGQTSPAGFFYKLGFRFGHEQKNEIMERWLREKTTEFPKITGMMYLPKNHINKLLMYKQVL